MQLNIVSRNSNSYQSSLKLYVTAGNLERVNPVWVQMNSVQCKDIKLLQQYQGKLTKYRWGQARVIAFCARGDAVVDASSFSNSTINRNMHTDLSS